MTKNTLLADVEECWLAVSPESETPPGADDNLFEQGADSFVFIQFVRELDSRFAIELPLRDVFLSPTFRTLANLISSQTEQARP